MQLTHHTPVSRKWPIAFWIPFALIWVSFLVSYAGDPVPLALASGMANVLSAALLAFGVWKLSTFAPLPARIDARFIATHVIAALIFAALWAFFALLVLFAVGEVLLEGPLEEQFVAIDRLEDFLDDYEDALWANPIIIFYRAVLGFWIYCAVVAATYAIDIRQRLRVESERAAIAEALAEEQRIHALGKHLGPHFLFNALHSVSALIPEHPQEAEHSIEQLGELLRYLLRDWSDSVVTLEEELAFAEQYLNLQKLRFRDRVTWSINTSDDLLSLSVPPLILQPMLENCFKHARFMESDQGHIEIGCTVNNGLAELTVADNGEGSAQQVIEAGEVHGLSQLLRRLQYSFGNSAGLKITTKPGNGFLVKVWFPVKADDGSD